MADPEDRRSDWSLKPTLPGWARLPPGTLLRHRFPVNWSAWLRADPVCGGPPDPDPRADPGCFDAPGRSRRMVLRSALAAPWSAPVRRLPPAVLAGGRSGAGSQRTTLAAPPPRPAGR